MTIYSVKLFYLQNALYEEFCQRTERSLGKESYPMHLIWGYTHNLVWRKMRWNVSVPSMIYVQIQDCCNSLTKMCKNLFFKRTEEVDRERVLEIKWGEWDVCKFGSGAVSRGHEKTRPVNCGCGRPKTWARSWRGRREQGILPNDYFLSENPEEVRPCRILSGGGPSAEWAP